VVSRVSLWITAHHLVHTGYTNLHTIQTTTPPPPSFHMAYKYPITVFSNDQLINGLSRFLLIYKWIIQSKLRPQTKHYHVGYFVESPCDFRRSPRHASADQTLTWRLHLPRWMRRITKSIHIKPLFRQQSREIKALFTQEMNVNTSVIDRNYRVGIQR
jgi:hypothetical protein